MGKHANREGGTKIFTHKEGGQTFLHIWGGQTFSVGSDGGNDDVDGEEEEEDVSEANILVSEASKLSAGARIFRGP